eukprot:NODE_18236_length_903_cov_4.440722.p1 GENE.NODE_18236_length_903_cov_4.440722~~NODE_18236_length_903_cov_4.440722.p1  ORF type:complete len:194 (-),score=55.31 NODE_18236_length_903_cov_4.440722:274-855(-)
MAGVLPAARVARRGSGGLSVVARRWPALGTAAVPWPIRPCAGGLRGFAAGGKASKFDVFRKMKDPPGDAEAAGDGKRKPSDKVIRLVDEIMSLTLIEAADLCDLCQEKLVPGDGSPIPGRMPFPHPMGMFGGGGMPQMGMAMPGAAPAAAPAPVAAAPAEAAPAAAPPKKKAAPKKKKKCQHQARGFCEEEED